MRSGRLLAAYYLLTPVFAAADIGLGASFRIPFLDAVPVLKYLYYGTSTLFGVLMLARPRLTAPLAALESLCSLCMLLVGFMASITAVAALPAGAIPVNPAGPQALVSFTLSAGILYGSYLRWTIRETAGPGIDELQERVRRQLER